MARVLVVDDDPSIREVIRFTLEDEGHETDEAENGRLALARVRRRHPDLVVLDMRMPEMDGWEFVSRYRRRYGRRAPILVLTAAQDVVRRAEEVDADAYLAKPFDLDDLIGLVAKLVAPADSGERR